MSGHDLLRGNAAKAPESFPDLLSYLNQNFSYPIDSQIGVPDGTARTSPPKPLQSALHLWIGRQVRRLLDISGYGDYVRAEAEYQMRMVQFLNAFAARMEALEKRLAREFSLRQDDLSSSLDSLRQRIHDEIAQSMHALRHEIELVKSRENDRNVSLERMDSVVRGLERVLTATQTKPVGEGAPPTDSPSGSLRASSTDLHAAGSSLRPEVVRYLLLENRFRGSEAAIRAKMLPYVDLFADAKGPVLELGPGRGELQKLFRERSVNSYGVDLDEGMVDLCDRDGLDVRREDILAHLESLAPGSLGGFIAVQVIEHLPQALLKDLLKLLKTRLAVGAKLVFETINTESMVALCRNYFRDPTHVWPMHPETTKFVLEMAGFEVLELRPLSPYPADALLPLIQVEEFATPRWEGMLARVNNNFSRLNELLYGNQDYCIIAQIGAA